MSLIAYPRALLNGVDGTFRSRNCLLFSSGAGEGKGGACGGNGEGGGTATGSGLAAVTEAGSASTGAVEPVPAISCVRAGCAGSCAGWGGGGGRSDGGSCGDAAALSWVKYTTEEDEEEGREDSVAGCSPAPGGGCGRRGVPLVRPARSVVARSADLRTSRGEVPRVASRATRAAPSSRRRRSLDAMGEGEGGVEGPWTKKRECVEAAGAARRHGHDGTGCCWAPREFHFMGRRLRG